MSLADTLFGKGKGAGFLSQDLGAALGVKPVKIEAPKIVIPKSAKQKEQKTSDSTTEASKQSASAPAIKVCFRLTGNFRAGQHFIFTEYCCVVHITSVVLHGTIREI
jgi:hypothetical protein